MVAIRTTVMQAKMGIVTFKEFINTLKELADRVKVPARTIKSLIELIIMELKLLASIRLIMVLDSNSILTLALLEYFPKKRQLCLNIKNKINFTLWLLLFCRLIIKQIYNLSCRFSRNSGNNDRLCNFWFSWRRLDFNLCNRYFWSINWLCDNSWLFLSWFWLFFFFLVLFSVFFEPFEFRSIIWIAWFIVERWCIFWTVSTVFLICK